MVRLVVLGPLCFVLVSFFLRASRQLQHYTGGSTSSRSSSSSSSVSSVDHEKNKEKEVQRSLTPNNVYYNGTIPLVNKWYGWQPKIPESMECSWTECMIDNHNCTTCRDSIDDMKVTNSSLLDPGPDWIPDVTMLRRMYMDGHDADGNPWPPPLDDTLCQALEEDNEERLPFDRVPIKSTPRPREPLENDNHKILCMIYAMEKVHHTRIRAIRETWAPQCDGFLAFSTKSDPRIPAISVPHLGPERYGNMWQKIRSMWMFVGKHYLSDFDWFYIGGDDMLTFPHNLKKFLENYRSDEPHTLGRVFQPFNISFNSGGPGYVLSRPALTCLLEHIEDPVCEPTKRTNEEDVHTADCLAKACNVTVKDTRDEKLRERFHHYGPQITWRYKGRIRWYQVLTRKVAKVKNGVECCAPDTVAFHYVKNPAMFRYFHHYVNYCNRSLETGDVDHTAVEGLTNHTFEISTTV